MSTYKIRCRVSGGVTGTREAWLKHGIPAADVVFHDMAEAEAEAKRLRDGVGQHTCARFQYWVVEQ